jgi:hypothetical protein
MLKKKPYYRIKLDIIKYIDPCPDSLIGSFYHIFKEHIIPTLYKLLLRLECRKVLNSFYRSSKYDTWKRQGWWYKKGKLLLVFLKNIDAKVLNKILAEQTSIICTKIQHHYADQSWVSVWLDWGKTWRLGEHTSRCLWGCFQRQLTHPKCGQYLNEGPARTKDTDLKCILGTVVSLVAFPKGTAILSLCFLAAMRWATLLHYPLLLQWCSDHLPTAMELANYGLRQNKSLFP